MSATEPQHPAGAGRRLAAIAFTDVVGYSARMQRDETGTLALVKADFGRLRERCAAHGGEVLKSTGDGLLLCFPSVVQAVECALGAQAEFAGRGPDALQHRIGIHLGDVFREGADVVGDGVNIAARLQTKARPGTVCASQSVYDAVKGKLPMQATPLGPQAFKNIAEPIPVWLMQAAGAASIATPRRRPRPWLAAAGAIVILALALFFRPRSSPAPVSVSGPPAKAPPAAPAIPERSIAVLPFTNMSDAKENAFFADGVHEDILTNLANLSAIKVISRTSVMQFRDTKKTIAQIGRELGVAYILEGSVRRDGRQIRVTGQLIKAATDEHIWAKAYDREVADVFAVQADIAREIAAALRTALSPGEDARLGRAPTTTLEAYEEYQRGMTLMRTGVPKVALSEALPRFEHAVALDPHYAEAWVQIAFLHNSAYWREGFPATRLAAARDAFARAETEDPSAFDVLNLGATLAALPGGNPAQVAHYQQRIIELYPNRSETCRVLSRLAIQDSRWEDALASAERARMLDPLNPTVLGQLEMVLLSVRRFDRAEEVEREIVRLVPDDYGAAVRLATTPFMRSGSTREFEALLARLSAPGTPDSAAIRASRLEIMILLGDAAGMIRFWRENGENLLWEEYSVRDARMLIAAAFIALGDPASARPLLEKNRDEALAALARDAAAPVGLNDLGLALAMLGDAEAGRAKLAQARGLIDSAPPARRNFLRWQGAIDRGWAGEKSEAIADLRDILRSRTMAGLRVNVHDLAASLLTLPLRDEPAFKAMLADPANNAPLF